MVRAMATLLLEHGIEIPVIRDLADFRRWALSDAFPQRGRIDYIAGRIEVDMSPEDAHETARDWWHRPDCRRAARARIPDHLLHADCEGDRHRTAPGDT